MGSKQSMLGRGLAQVIGNELQKRENFADLFSGSAAVARHVAENHNVTVLATDLQGFSATLANSILLRTSPGNADSVWRRWTNDAFKNGEFDDYSAAFLKFELFNWDQDPVRAVSCAREMCSCADLPVTRAYGGHYFSPLQALLIDRLRSRLPIEEPMRSLCLSALLEAAASCVAAPGHTAQPFKPSPSASRFLFEHWRRSVLSLTERKLHELSNRFSRKQGVARVGDAEGTSECLDERFVAFVDPPYSGVQYSRFYHVLETINDGEFVNVTGIGRYPPILERPQSDYSIPSRSVKAIDLLLKNLASNGVVSILTFPTGATSNGLSGTLVEDLASEYFFVEKIVISGRFSTLGGNKVNRLSRVPAHEAIMTMRPR